MASIVKCADCHGFLDCDKWCMTHGEHVRQHLELEPREATEVMSGCDERRFFMIYAQHKA